jgi:hypothetical protein
MDISYISAALAGMTQVLNIGKTIEDQKVVTAINSAVVEITSKLIEAQRQIVAVQEENQRLREQLRALQDVNRLESLVSFHHGAYWTKREDGSEEGPFCPSCWGLEKKLVYPSVSNSNVDPMELVCTLHEKSKRFRVPTKLAIHLCGR